MIAGSVSPSKGAPLAAIRQLNIELWGGGGEGMQKLGGGFVCLQLSFALLCALEGVSSDGARKQ